VPGGGRPPRGPQDAVGDAPSSLRRRPHETRVIVIGHQSLAPMTSASCRPGSEPGGSSGRFATNGSSQLLSGSASRKTARTSKDIGTARSAPSGPRTQDQKTRERKVIVVERPTAPPTMRGWIPDWMIRFRTAQPGAYWLDGDRDHQSQDQGCHDPEGTSEAGHDDDAAGETEKDHHRARQSPVQGRRRRDRCHLATSSVRGAGHGPAPEGPRHPTRVTHRQWYTDRGRRRPRPTGFG